jgi:hypothetical protein
MAAKYIGKKPEWRDLIIDQVAFLLSHSDDGKCKMPDCRDCARLKELERLLLEPFEWVRYGGSDWRGL